MSTDFSDRIASDEPMGEPDHFDVDKLAGGLFRVALVDADGNCPAPTQLHISRLC